MKIYLIGYRCTGKTSIGKQLSQLMSIPFWDTDERITAMAGSDITTLVSQQGWAAFRKMEKNVLAQTMDLNSVVVSTGGGIVLDPENRRILRENGICFWLQADIHTIVQRIEKDEATAAQRPALSRLSLMDETCDMLRQRTPLYQKTQHYTVNTDQCTQKECADIILRRIQNVRF